MKKLSVLKNFAFAAASAATLTMSACTTTAPELGKDFVLESPETLKQMVASNPADNASGMVTEPGKIYIADSAAALFSVKQIETSINEEGLLKGCVVGATAEMPFWDWLFHGEKPYEVEYRFLWFHQDGKPYEGSEAAAADLRLTMPGNPVRFSAIAPTEDCKKFSFVILFR